MPLSLNSPARRLGLAVAAAVAAALAAALAFDAFDPGTWQPLRVGVDADRPPAVLDRVPVRPSEAPGLDDAPDAAVAIEAPPPAEGDGLPQPEPTRGAPVVMAPPDRPAAAPAPPRDAPVAMAPPDRPAASPAPRPAPPAEPERRAPATPSAPPRDRTARTVDATPETGLARRLNREGIDLINAGRPDQAIAVLERAASLQPRDAEVLGNLGYAYMLVGENAAASRNLRRALAFAPNRSATWLNLGQTYAELGQRDLAVDAVVIGYRHSTRKASVRAALTAAATGARYSPQWREAAGMALARIGDG